MVASCFAFCCISACCIGVFSVCVSVCICNFIEVLKWLCNAFSIRWFWVALSMAALFLAILSVSTVWFASNMQNSVFCSSARVMPLHDSWPVMLAQLSAFKWFKSPLAEIGATVLLVGCVVGAGVVGVDCVVVLGRAGIGFDVF